MAAVYASVKRKKINHINQKSVGRVVRLIFLCFGCRKNHWVGIEREKSYILKSGGKDMRLANIIAYALVIVGAVNWGLFGLFDVNLVSMVFNGARATGSIVVYSLIAISALWLIVSPLMTGGALRFNDREA